MHENFKVTSDLYATQGQRVGNYLLDMVIYYALTFLIAIIVAFIAQLVGAEGLIYWMSNINGLQEYLLGVLIILFYYSTTEILLQRSIAKFITNTVVVMADGTKPEPHIILKRTFCRLIPLEQFSFLGASGRGWHDSISETFVVNKKELDQRMKEFSDFEQIGNTTEQL